MKLRNGLFAVFSITLLSFAGWFAVLQTVDPFSVDAFSRSMFFVFLLLSVSGASCLTLYYIGRKNKQSDLYAYFQNSFRVGLLIGTALCGLLVLETINVLNVLSATVYLLAIVLMEFYMRTKRKNYA